MPLRVNLWNDENEQEIGITVQPYTDGKYVYTWQAGQDKEWIEGEGELFSLIPLAPLDIVESITTSIKERLRKDE